MIVSGKKVLLVMLISALSLSFWVRYKASMVKVPDSVLQKIAANPEKKPQRGYRSKMLPTMEQARGIAEKRIKNDSKIGHLITKYKSYDDGWLFDYETEKYLNSGKPEDRDPENKSILVHNDGTSEYISEVK